MATAAGKKSTKFSVPHSWKHAALKVEEELSTMATQYWAEGAQTEKWHHEQAWMGQIQEVQIRRNK